MLQAIGVFLQMLFLVVSSWFERDAAKKKKKEETRKEMGDAIKAKDTSRINASIDRIKRLR